eukprot:TRINITY_DN33287_c0_g1_i1.p1 TRINITY_DN33287_c0_g1~~TRINITY_DN33287_c0_g1_i1.p1  ORF type:complete len:464 (+),score=119.40 TRINITY_DN33287_c0_g1_i1:46-1392(+)
MKSILIVLATLLVNAHGKGSAGYRSYKGGSYSQSRVYGVGGIIIWSHGYSGGRGGTSNPSNHVTSLNQLGISEDDVFCRRDVRLDHPSYTTVNHVTINSTRYCYKEVTTTHGSPSNIEINSTWLDVYQWSLSAGKGIRPTIKMTQYDDKAFDTPNNNSIFNVVLTSLKERSTGNEIDLRTLEWKATRVAPASKPVWGYPASYFKDEASLTSFSVNGVSASGDTDVVLTFTAASDFAEDAYEDYTFMRPSGLRVEMTVRASPYKSTNHDLGVEFVVVSAIPTHSVGRPISTKFGTEYDPRSMNRVEVGMPADTETRGRHFFSWKASTSTRMLCAGMHNAYCAELDTSLCSTGLCQICNNATAVEDVTLCDELAVPAGGRASRLTIWARNSSDDNLYNLNFSNYVETNYLSWAFVVGTWDYAEQVVKESSAMSMPSLLLLTLSVLVSFVM